MTASPRMEVDMMVNINDMTDRERMMASDR